MKKAVFITVRTDSNRLANKALLPILGKPTIEMVILRAKQVKRVDEVVLCTTTRPLDDQLVEIAKKNRVNYFRGSFEDKLDRWFGATKVFNIDFFATMDGDDLLCDPELITTGIDQMERENCDFIKAPKDLICGSFTYCVKTSALEKVCSIKGTNDTEMMWVYFENTGMFDVRDLDVRDPIFFNADIRLTLDYQEDFEFFRSIFEHFDCKNNDVPLREIVSFLKSNPEIIKINSFRQQDYLANQKKKTKLVIKEGND
jgi:spore coat polysaccharide biosynthesis protein SpsF (cytidylyltransferase family)